MTVIAPGPCTSVLPVDAATVGLSASLYKELRGWLCAGATQTDSGAFCAWVDAEDGQRSFEYPEITGYALTHLASLDDPTDPEIIAGLRAGSWLVARLGRGDFSARDGWDGGAVYNFDLAMICNGLLTFGRRYEVADFCEIGLMLARRLRDQTTATGELAPLPLGASSSRSAWSTDGRALMVKAAQCLLSAADLDPSQCFGEAADAVIRMAQHIQQDDGRIVTHPADHETMCHPHLYAVEGLWVYGQSTGDSESLERARAGTEWVWRHQLDTGALPRYVDTNTGERGPEQLDVTAQAVRAAAMTGLDMDDAIEAAIGRLGDMVVAVEGGAALPYQPAGDRHLNVWVTLFGTQALDFIVHLAAVPSVPMVWHAVV